MMTNKTREIILYGVISETVFDIVRKHKNIRKSTATRITDVLIQIVIHHINNSGKNEYFTVISNWQIANILGISESRVAMSIRLAKKYNIIYMKTGCTYFCGLTVFEYGFKNEYICKNILNYIKINNKGIKKCIIN
jgi:hypothetical protein